MLDSSLESVLIIIVLDTIIKESLGINTYELSNGNV
jgi:hypothetical protein